MTHTTSIKQDVKQGLTLFVYQLKKSRTPLIIFAVIAAFFITVIFSLTSVSTQSIFQFTGAMPSAEETELMRQRAILSFQTVSAAAVFVLTCVFTLIYTLRVFSYLHNKRKADWINPLPVRAGVLFLAKALAAFAAAVVPALVFIGIICLIAACCGVPVQSEVLLLFARIPLGCGACIAFYGLMAVCCGSSANTMLSFLAICFCYPLATGFIRGILQSFFFGLPSDMQHTHFIWKALNPLAAYDGANVLYWLLFTAGCCALSLLLLRRRKAERVQTNFAYRLPCYAVEMLITFIAGMLMGVVFASFKVLGAAFGGFAFGFILGGGTAFIIAHVILFKGFARIAKSLIFYGVINAAAIGFTAICCFASPAYVNALPAREQIQSAGFVEYTYDMASVPSLSDPIRLMNNSAKDFTEEKEVTLIYNAQQKLVNDYQKLGTEKKFRNVISQAFGELVSAMTGYAANNNEYFAFTLKDGGTVTRAYNTSLLMNGLLDSLSGDYSGYSSNYDYAYYSGTQLPQITQSSAYLAKYSTIANLTAAEINEIQVYDNGYDSTCCLPHTAQAQPDLEKVINALKADYPEHGECTISTDLEIWLTYEMPPTHSAITAITLLSANTNLSNSFSRTDNFLYIPQQYTRTRAALQEIGVLTKEGKLNKQSAYWVESEQYFYSDIDPLNEPSLWDKNRDAAQGDVIAVGTGTLTMPFPCERRTKEGLDCFFDIDGELLLFESNSITEVYYDEGKHPGTEGKNAFADSFQVLSLETKDTETMSDGCFGTAKVKADGKELTLRYIQFGKTVGDQVFYCTDKLSDEAFAQLQMSFSVGQPDAYVY